jgi:hypothetical protein
MENGIIGTEQPHKTAQLKKKLFAQKIARKENICRRSWRGGRKYI